MKILSLIATLALVVLIVGCGTTVQENTQDTTPTIQEPVDDQLEEIDQIDSDVELGELEDLDKELEELDW